jgi:D-cysteine desulfhydrase family pyridoxal phosphate-dependent enzyme
LASECEGNLFLLEVNTMAHKKAAIAVLASLIMLLLVGPAGAAEDLNDLAKHKLKRVQVAHLPTPLEEMKRLTEAVGGPRLFIKRDDQTGLAFGGNKARKLDFIFADILEKKADVVITWAGVQSNWARQTAAACRMLGLEPILVLSKNNVSPESGGNLLLDAILEADVRILEPGEDRSAIVEGIVAEVKAKGLTPYTVPVGGSRPAGDMEIPLGAVAYAYGFEETYQQAREKNIPFNHLVVATGSGGTQAGLMVGAKAIAPDVKIVGISVSGEKQASQKNVAAIANQTAEVMGLDLQFTPEETIILDDYRGEGYGALSKQIVDAIAMAAKHEGIMIDPVYTGKAMAGMIDLSKKGYFKKDEGVVFLHTGGTPGLFAYENQILDYMKKNK